MVAVHVLALADAPVEHSSVGRLAAINRHVRDIGDVRHVRDIGARPVEVGGAGARSVEIVRAVVGRRPPSSPQIAVHFWDGGGRLRHIDIHPWKTKGIEQTKPRGGTYVQDLTVSITRSRKYKYTRYMV